MEEQSDLYTKIFIDSDADKLEIIAAVSEMIGGRVSDFSITTGLADILLFKNSDYDEVKRNQGTDAFLYYRYCLEIEPAVKAEGTFFVEEISDLLVKLWDAGYKAVAACSYEESLPRKGGYRP